MTKPKQRSMNMSARAAAATVMLLAIVAASTPVNAVEVLDTCERLAPGDTCDVHLEANGDVDVCSTLEALSQFSCYGGGGVPSCQDLLDANLCAGQLPSCQDLVGESACEGQVIEPFSEVVSCYTQGMRAEQITEQDLNAKLPDASAYAEEIHSASQATGASVTDLCLTDDGGDDDGSSSCVSNHGTGYAAIVCNHGCGFYPRTTSYSVGTTGADPGEEPPLVYGAVWCAPGFTPAPPVGVSCADNGHCDAEAEGFKVLSGYCVHTAFGNLPEIIGHTCKW